MAKFTLHPPHPATVEPEIDPAALEAFFDAREPWKKG